MNLHMIADVCTDMGYKYEKMKRQTAAYRVCGGNPEIKLYLDNEFLAEKQKENPHLNLEDCEYIFTGSLFYTALLKFGGFMLHSSAVIAEGKAYLFSAPSGTGKSTHTALWQKVYGKDKIRILNDDKPAVRIMKDGIYAYGTPWSGNCDLNINERAPVGGICFLDRGENNIIEQTDGGNAVSELLNQTIRPQSAADMDLLLRYADIVLNNVPIYKMRCNMTENAAVCAYKKMVK